MGLFDSVIKKMDIEQKEVYSVEESRALTDICLATMALSTYAAACDGEVSIDEYMEADLNIAAINKEFHLPDTLLHQVKDLSMKHGITWDEVKNYLDVLSVDTLRSMQNGLKNVVGASDGVNEAEQKVLNQFDEYILSR